MDITLCGKLYIHFIKSVFESNKKIGIQIIIDNYKSDNTIVDGLKRLKLLDKNTIFIENENIKLPIKIYEHKYDKIEKIIDKKLYIPTYSYGKKKTVEKIMDIINNNI